VYQTVTPEIINYNRVQTNSSHFILRKRAKYTIGTIMNLNIYAVNLTSMNSIDACTSYNIIWKGKQPSLVDNFRNKKTVIPTLFSE